MIADELLTVRAICDRVLANKFARARTVTIAGSSPRVIHVVLQGRGAEPLGLEQLIREAIGHAAGADAGRYGVMFDWEPMG